MAKQGIEYTVSLNDKATAQWNTFTKQIEGGVTRLSNAFQSFGGYVAGAFSVAALDKFVAASNEQEKASASLAQALKTVGAAGDGVQASMEEFARSIQKTTTYADEEVIKLQSMLVQMTGLSGKAVEPLTKAVLDLSTGMGVSVEMATRMIGKTQEGTEGLKKLGITIGDTSNEEERLSRIVEEVNKRFGGQAEAAGKTGAGAMAQFKNSVNDLEETLGDLIKRALLPILPALSSFVETLTKLPTPVLTAALAMGTLTAAIGLLNATLLTSPITLTLIGIAGAVVALTGSLAGSAGAFKEEETAIEGANKEMTENVRLRNELVFKNNASILKDEIENYDKLSEKIDKASFERERSNRLLKEEIESGHNASGRIKELTQDVDRWSTRIAVLRGEQDAHTKQMVEFLKTTKGQALGDVIDKLKNFGLTGHEIDIVVKTMTDHFDEYNKTVVKTAPSIAEAVNNLSSLRKELSEANTRVAESAIGTKEYFDAIDHLATVTDKANLAEHQYTNTLDIFLGKLDLTKIGVMETSKSFEVLGRTIDRSLPDHLKPIEVPAPDTSAVDEALQAWELRLFNKFADSFQLVAGFVSRALGDIGQALAQSTDAEIASIESKYRRESTMIDRQKSAELKAISERKTAEIRAIDERLKSATLSTEERKQLELDRFNLENKLDDDRNNVEIKYQTEKQKREDAYNLAVSEAKKKAFEQNKIVSILESIINTAVGVTNALRTADIPLAIAVGALGAFETGLIASQPAPAFAEGGSFVVPPGYPNDSFPMRVQSGERVTVETPGQQQTNSHNNTLIFNFNAPVDGEEMVWRSITNRLRNTGLDITKLAVNQASKVVIQ